MMIKTTKIAVILMSLVFSIQTSAEQIREIALTIDDLPFVGSTNNKPGNLRREKERFLKMLDAIKENQVPAVGFVIAGTIEQDQWQLLEAFKNAGLTIGNHTYSHPSLNQVGAERYIKEIERSDAVLSPLMTGPKFFRYPYLAEGRGQDKEEVRQYLEQLNYTIAPVTIDSKDFKFNERLLNIYWRNRLKNLPSIKRQYLNYIWSQTLRAEKRAGDKPVRQILLIHANYLNAYVLDDLIKMYKEKGYKFITLEEALKSPPDYQVETLQVQDTHELPSQPHGG